jgi:plastocyanin
VYKRLFGLCSIVVLTGVGTGVAGLAGVDVKGTTRVGSRAQATAVIWLEAPNAPRAVRQKNMVLHQRNLTFLPHVLAVRMGTTVEFPNEDRVFHNVFSFRDGKPFDLGIYPVGSRKQVTFSAPGVTRLFCNIHPHMAGYVVAVDSPYFSAVEEDGTFTIPAVPPGTYTYHAWKPGSPVLTGSAVVQAGSPLDVTWR